MKELVRIELTLHDHVIMRLSATRCDSPGNIQLMRARRARWANALPPAISNGSGESREPTIEPLGAIKEQGIVGRVLSSPHRQFGKRGSLQRDRLSQTSACCLWQAVVSDELNAVAQLAQKVCDRVNAEHPPFRSRRSRIEEFLLNPLLRTARTCAQPSRPFSAAGTCRRKNVET